MSKENLNTTEEQLPEETIENNDELSSLYENESETSELTKIRRPYGAARVLRIARLFSFIVVLTTILSITWLHTTYTKPVDTDLLFVNIKGDKIVESLEETSYTIFYENRNKVGLHNSTLDLTLPENFILTRVDDKPYNLTVTSFSLPPIDAQQNGELTISGVYVSKPDTVHTLSATWLYQNTYSTTQNTANATITTEIKPTDILLTIDKPEIFVYEEDISYVIKAQNNADHPIENARLVVEFPSNFIETNSSLPKIIENDNFKNSFHSWDIASLSPKETYELTIKGRYTRKENNDSTNNELNVKLGLVHPYTHEIIVQTDKSQKTVTESEKDIIITAIINGSTDTKPITLGQDMLYSINIKNPTESTLSNLKLHIDITDPESLINWEKAKDLPKQEDTDSGTKLTFTTDSIEKLKTLAPGDEVSIDFALPIKNTLEENNKEILIATTISLEANQQQDDQAIAYNKEIDAILSPLLSDTSITAAGRYYINDTKVGDGPVPPRVDKTTSYAIVLELNNTINDIEDIKISIPLTQETTWEGNQTQSTGSVIYNPNTHTVEWTISRLPHTIENAQAQFNISITPTSDNQGAVIYLTDAITLEAQDIHANFPITLSENRLNTNIEGDKEYEGLGVVVE